MSLKNLVLLGDSNTEFGSFVDGWVYCLSKELYDKCNVFNRGYAGHTSKNLITILPEILAEFNPNSICGVVILIGTNDCCPAYFENIHVPLNTYIDNLNNIINYIIKLGIDKSKIMIVSPPKKVADNLVKDYAAAAIEIANRKQILSYDLYKAFEDYGSNFNSLLSDGLHFSKLGHNLLFNALKPLIEKLINQ